MEQDKDIIPETVIKFLQTVLTGKTDYSQPLNIVEQPTNCRHWWQDQTTKTHHVSLCVQVSDWEYRSDAYHGSTGLWCFIHTNCGNWHGTVPSKAGKIPDWRDIAKKHLPGCIIFIIIIIKLYFQAHMQTITKAQRTHSIALHSWAI